MLSKGCEYSLPESGWYREVCTSGLCEDAVGWHGYMTRTVTAKDKRSSVGSVGWDS